MHLSDDRYPLENFLARDPNFTAQPGQIFGSVYYIKDHLHDKYYVGSTINITRRAREYIRAAMRDPSEQDSSIIKALREFGLETFTMYEIMQCNSDFELAYWELYYTRELDSYYNGYNDSFNTSARVKPTSRKEHVRGMQHAAANRQKRSYECLFINPIKKECYLSDSAALFGEVVADAIRSQVSNAIKTRTRLKDNWYGIYTDVFPFSYEKTTKFSNTMIMATGLFRGRSNYIFREVFMAFMRDSHRFLIANDFKCFELRYADNEQRYSLTEVNIDK